MDMKTKLKGDSEKNITEHNYVQFIRNISSYRIVVEHFSTALFMLNLKISLPKIAYTEM